MTAPIGRVFLSYASADGAEVDRFDLALRRCGVPLWRDRAHLLSGRPVDVEIERAAAEAAGFVFYLTERAARSEWVREHERAYALRNARLAQGSFGLVPVFRDDKDVVSAEMLRLAGRPGDPSYDLRGYQGYLFGRPPAASLDDELAAAADHVLRSLLATVTGRLRPGERVRLGLATRGGPKLGDLPLDLLVDWSADYDGHVPDAAFGETVALPALAALAAALGAAWPSLRLEVVPQCHLTLALAAGFQFRRNVGADLEVVDVHTKERWQGPASPLPGTPDAWATPRPRLRTQGPDLAIAIGISRPIARTVKSFLHAAAAPVGRLLVFEPKVGASLTALKGLPAATFHRMAVAVVDAITAAQSTAGRATVHLFVAGPAPFAVLLGQQLSNVGPVQTYEWLDSQQRYAPSLVLRSS